KKSVTIKTQTKTMYAGGVAGYAAADIESCSNEGAIVLDGEKDLHPTTINSEQAYFGGVVGYPIKGITLTSVQNKGSVTMQNIFTTNGALSYIGGVNGSYQGTIAMTDCANSGTVTNNATTPVCIGGISGAFNGVMTNTQNTGLVVNASDFTSPTAGKESEVAGIAGYANATFTNVENSAEVASAAEGSFVSGFVGGFGAASDPITWTGTVNCAVSGAATTKASVLGRFRSEGTTVINLGADGAPFAIKGGAASLPVCGLANGNSVNEVNVTH
ncbi:MAG: hypothetical protein II421_06895, partial [Bacteroidales bacterium]|nr:hypothetical protein [Bacteroidales bacterium]